MAPESRWKFDRPHGNIRTILKESTNEREFVDDYGLDGDEVTDTGVFSADKARILKGTIQAKMSKADIRIEAFAAITLKRAICWLFWEFLIYG